MKNPATKTAGYLNAWNCFFKFGLERRDMPMGNVFAMRFAGSLSRRFDPLCFGLKPTRGDYGH